jgi:hypothetical protein
MDIIKKLGNGHPHHCRSKELTVTVPVGSTELIPRASGETYTILSAWRGKVQKVMILLNADSFSPRQRCRIYRRFGHPAPSTLHSRSAPIP